MNLPQRLTLRAALLALAAPAVLVLPLAPAAAQTERSGVVVADVANAQAAPGETSYVVAKLTRGQKVTVVGMKFGKWLQILPPQNSFTLVPAGHVNRTGPASFPTEGEASRDLNVRIASRVNDLKWAFADRRIPAGTRLTILGETEDQFYYMIPPPEGVFYYVEKDAVTPEHMAPPELRGDEAEMPEMPEMPERPPVEPPVNGELESSIPPMDPINPVVDDTARTPLTGNPDDVGNTIPEDPTAPLRPIGDDAPAMADEDAPDPLTPSTPEAAEEFMALETLHADLVALDVEEQTPGDLDALATEYRALLATDGLGGADTKIAELRVKGLEGRRDALEKLLEVRRQRAAEADATAAMQAETEALEQEVEQTMVQRFDAVGTLRSSKLRLGDQTLYRLTDPRSGYTMLYVHPAEGVDLAALVGDFVGVRGEMTDDTRVGSLRYLLPTAAEAVEITRIGNGVTADMIPASVRPTNQ